MEPKKTTKAAEPRILKLATVKTYQDVEFHKKMDKYFTAKRSGMESITIEFHIDDQLIYLKSDKDLKIIMPTNVAYMEPLE